MVGWCEKWGHLMTHVSFLCSPKWDASWCLYKGQEQGLYHPQSWHGWLAGHPDVTFKMKWSTCLVGGDWNMAGLWLSIHIGNGIIIPIDELIFFRGVGSTTNQVWCFVACTYAFSHLKLIQLADDVGCFAASLPLPFQLRSDVGSGNWYEDEKCKKEGWSIYTEEWQWLYFCW